MMVADILSGIGYTILITVASLVIGAIVGLPFAAARRSRFAPLRFIAGGYIDIARGIPPITWIFLIYFGLPQYEIYLEPIAAAIFGLSLISSAYMAEIYRAGILSVPSGQWEAAHALGMSARTRTAKIVAPQTYRVVFTASAVYAIGLLKDSALASTIGVQELTYNANEAARETHNGLLAFAVAGLVYVVLSIPCAIAARRVDRVLSAKLGVA